MSHYGEPPPDESAGESGQQPGQQEPPPTPPPAPPPPGGAHAGEPAPYSPYPDNWNEPQQSQGRFVAGEYGVDPAAQPPPNPYGTPQAANPYGTPQVANPYASNPNPNKPTFGFGGYAGWFARVGAYLIDQILSSIAGAPLWVGYVVLLSNTTTTTNPDGTTTSHYHGSIGLPLVLIIFGALTTLAFFVWNICIRQGRTGASVGKSVLAIRLVNSDLQPIGGGWCFLRYLLHIIDGLPCYLGYLWPIWDSRKQTFADKILTTFVISATTPEPRPY
ncbi:MAG: RDD family protein [Nocardioides sp.]